MYILFEILGILLSSFIGAIVLIYKFTGDLAPAVVKRLLNRIALSNWQRTQESRLGFYNADNPKNTSDTRILPCPEEDLLERPKKLEQNNETDELTFYGIDDNGNGLYVEMTRFYGDITMAKLHLFIDGNSYSVSRRGINSSENEFTLGNFKLEMIESMRSWRIWYNGILRNENNGTCVHAVLNFLWKPFDSPLDTKRDLNLHLLSRTCTELGTFGPSLFEILTTLPDGYRQFGTHHGTIRLDNGPEERLYLYGFRSRKWNSLQSIQSKTSISNSVASYPKYQLELFGMTGCDGNAFTLTSGINGGWVDGQTLFPSNKKFQIRDVDIGTEMFQNTTKLPKLFAIKDQKRTFHIEVWPKTFTHEFPQVKIIWLTLTINGKPGRGILVKKFQPTCSSSSPDTRLSSLMDTTIKPGGDKFVTDTCHVIRQLDLSHQPDKVPEIVSFKSEYGREIGIVGGKGASLAELCQLSLHDANFNTAKGFCVTTSSFKRHLPLDEFRELFSKGTKSLEEMCSLVRKKIIESSAKEQIKPQLNSWISDVFGKDNIKLAVRSSGILEDGAELSCAGQNETFLGIHPSDVAEKVVTCWASLFTLQSVQYRLTHGQPAVSEMAVVIQEMVNASAAGVVFTADPVTGNPFQILISANYGLGESVVSASCDPDTIKLIRSSSSPDLQIAEQYLGKKQTKVVLTTQGSTIEIESDTEEQASYCITSQVAINLGKVAVTIEKALGNLKPVDIEWAVDQVGGLYILQCRPITSLDAWTDFELIHEADSPYNTTFEWITHANTGEVLPGVTSPLSLSVILKLLDVGIQIRSKERSGSAEPIVPYALKKTACARNRFLLNVLNAMYPSVDKEITPDKVASDFSIFGHRVMDEELHALALDRNDIAHPVQKIRELFSLIKTIWQSEKEIIRATQAYSTYTIPLDSVGGDPKKLYQLITERIYDLYEVALSHCMMSESSTVTQMFALLSLAQGRKADEWDSDIYEDVSKVLSVCMDVESADLPSAMNHLATTIVNIGGSREIILSDFVDQPAPTAFHWLTSHKNITIPEAVAEFFEKHGHRCIAELDLMRKSWKSDPVPFVNLLQSLVRNKIKFDSSKANDAKTSKYKNDKELVSSLHTQLGFVAKSFLKFLLPYCRRAVWNREKTKSYFVRIGDQLKQGYELLAQKMVEGQFLPDKHLLYFMTHHQIGLLLNRHTSSPKILNKAMRNMKLFPELHKEEYPEITVGIRLPVERQEDVEYEDSLKATPVSSGKVQAPGKVCKTIEEATRLIEPGDILITHGTDIGWSPFFPILGGIVTELGGLISHGAVVAREYGLPCIVGAANATKIFKTGEMLLLDAGKGTIAKVKASPRLNHVES